MHLKYWELVGIALLAISVFLAWFFLRRSRRSGQKARMEKRNLDLGYHLVALLDVQGQRQRFRQLQLPKNPEEAAAVGEVLRQTAGFVLDLRQAFEEQFESFAAGTGDIMKWHTGEPLRPRFAGFSDSFVASVPLRNDRGDLLSIVSVFSALSAAAVVMLMSLASKHPLRGGIDVGLATKIGPQEIYGPVLGSAYVLESEVAGYPRIVIGDELWRYFDSELGRFRAQTTPVARALAEITERMMGLIATDTDGKRILDYMGQTMVLHAGPGGGQKDILVRRAYEFVLAEQKRIVEAQNSKLIPRYEALRRYVESRLPLWGIEVTKA